MGATPSTKDSALNDANTLASVYAAMDHMDRALESAPLHLRRKIEPTTRWGDHEYHYTVEQAARILNLSRDSVRRLFMSEPGVIVIESPRKRYKRTYRTLRIPASVFGRVYNRLKVKA